MIKDVKLFLIYWLTKDVIMSYELPGIKDKTATERESKTTLNNTLCDILAASLHILLTTKKMKT